MKCMKCGHKMYESTTTEAVELGGGVLVIRHIPCMKCDSCDEIQFTGDVVKRLEEIIANAKDKMQEVAVLDFAKAA